MLSTDSGIHLLLNCVNYYKLTNNISTIKTWTPKFLFIYPNRNISLFLLLRTIWITLYHLMIQIILMVPIIHLIATKPTLTATFNKIFKITQPTVLLPNLQILTPMNQKNAQRCNGFNNMPI